LVRGTDAAKEGDSCVNRQAVTVAVVGLGHSGDAARVGIPAYVDFQVIDDDLTMPAGRIAAAGPEETE
jgi:hypothetical protein